MKLYVWKRDCTSTMALVDMLGKNFYLRGQKPQVKINHQKLQYGFKLYFSRVTINNTTISVLNFWGERMHEASLVYRYMQTERKNPHVLLKTVQNYSGLLIYLNAYLR